MKYLNPKNILMNLIFVFVFICINQLKRTKNYFKIHKYCISNKSNSINYSLFIDDIQERLFRKYLKDKSKEN